MYRILLIICAMLCFSSVTYSKTPTPKPLKLAVAGLSHAHVHGLLGRPDRGDIEIVGIQEPNQELVERIADQYGLQDKLFFSDLDKMLDGVKPQAVVAFGSIYDHLHIVQSCALRGIHVMVEKPLAVNLEHARAIEALAKKYSIHVLTNYETTWFPSTQTLCDLVRDQQVTGPIRKIVVHDGHEGPQEIGVNPEFLEWLIDPVRNGGGALTDFGCYGANLVSWLMDGASPLTVTAVTQQIKPEIYPAVEDEATIILTYPKSQAIIQASWNWPFSRKDIQVYGKSGYVHALDGIHLRIRKEGETDEQSRVLEQNDSPLDDPFAYLTAVVREDIKLADTDLSALANNILVVRILDAAKKSAITGKTVTLAPR